MRASVQAEISPHFSPLERCLSALPGGRLPTDHTVGLPRKPTLCKDESTRRTRALALALAQLHDTHRHTGRNSQFTRLLNLQHSSSVSCSVPGFPGKLSFHEQGSPGTDVELTQSLGSGELALVSLGTSPGQRTGTSSHHNWGICPAFLANPPEVSKHQAGATLTGCVVRPTRQTIMDHRGASGLENHVAGPAAARCGCHSSSNPEGAFAVAESQSGTDTVRSKVTALMRPHFNVYCNH